MQLIKTIVSLTQASVANKLKLQGAFCIVVSALKVHYDY